MRAVVLAAVLLAGCAGSGGSVTASQRAVETRLADLLAAAAATDASIETLATFMVARGDDPARRWKAPADLSDASERAFVEQAHDELVDLLALVQHPDGGFEYEVEEYVVESESEGQWHVLEVEFETDVRDVVAMFAFLPLGGTYYLGEIER